MQRQTEFKSPVGDLAKTFRFRREPEDLITSKFSRLPVDNDDTVPCELYSAPYERIAVVPDSSPYALLEVSRSISATTNLVADDDFAIDIELEEPARPSRLLAAVLLAGAFGLGLGLSLLIF